MKYFYASLFPCLLFFSLAIPAVAQDRDSLFQEMTRATTDSARIRQFYNILLSVEETADGRTLHYPAKALQFAQEQKHLALEAVVTAETGYILYSRGNSTSGVNTVLKALQLAEKAGNQQAIGIAYENLGVCYAGDPQKQKVYFQKAIAASSAAGDLLFAGAELNNLSKVYLQEKQLDSALHYAQRTYALAIKTQHPMLLLYSLNSLSSVNYALGNRDIAYGYLREALAHKSLSRDRRSAIQTNLNIAGLFQKESQIDSSLHYARQAYDQSASSYIVYRQEPARLLKELYTSRNSDSALKYTNLFHAVKDSLYSRAQVQQLELFNFEENLRQQKAEEERQATLQYTAIGFLIISFAVLYLLLSTRLVVPAKAIEFLGVIGLLVVFEFLNLLLHPVLGNITHHSPMLMLLAMVVIAGLLVPLHHKLEHWITHKMVQKNRALQAARAQKVLQPLEVH